MTISDRGSDGCVTGDTAPGECHGAASGLVVAIVAAAGSGTRLGAAVPKAFVPVGGALIIAHAIAGIRDSGAVDRVVVTTPATMTSDQVNAAIGGCSPGVDGGGALPPVDVIAGGAERADSVARALAHIARQPWGDRVSVVLVHDAARCLTPPRVFSSVTDAVRGGAVAVIPVVPVTDTIKTVAGDGVTVTGTPERSTLKAAQTPQGFDYTTLVEANARRARSATDSDWQPTDDASLVAWAGFPVVTVEGDPEALKITTPLDLVVAEHIVAARSDLPRAAC